MKNNKGFLGVLLLMIVAAVLIGGGGAYVYIYTHNTSVPVLPVSQTDDRNTIKEKKPPTTPSTENKISPNLDTDCGVSTSLSSGKNFTNAEYEQDTALSCLGKKILNNCEYGEVIIDPSDTNTKITIEGTTEQNCALKISYPAADKIKTVDFKKYANKNISCAILAIIKDAGIIIDPRPYPAAYTAGLLQYMVLSSYFAPDKLEKIGCTGDLLTALKSSSFPSRVTDTTTRPVTAEQSVETYQETKIVDKDVLAASYPIQVSQGVYTKTVRIQFKGINIPEAVSYMQLVNSESGSSGQTKEIIEKFSIYTYGIHPDKEKASVYIKSDLNISQSASETPVRVFEIFRKNGNLIAVEKK